MISLAIVDDESKIRSLLRTLIVDHCPWVEVVGEAESVESGTRLITREEPEVVLLDVQMQDGIGFDILDNLPEMRPHIIFVTAFNEYAVRALRAGAVDYIEKPIHPDELMQALQRVRAKIQQNTAPAYQELIRTLKEKNQERIAVPTGSGLKYLKVADITHVKAEGAYCFFHFDGTGRPLLVSRMMAEVQAPLEKVGFVRVHRSYLINTAKVKELSRTDGGSVLMTCQTRIPFSKSYKEKAIGILGKGTLFL